MKPHHISHCLALHGRMRLKAGPNESLEFLAADLFCFKTRLSFLQLVCSYWQSSSAVVAASTRRTTPKSRKSSLMLSVPERSAYTRIVGSSENQFSGH